jgi:glyoxylase-like metal-dependent hydrolase (beta-lactamase superfamily II)/rhodanese-related sulfurtransferase
MMFSQLNPHHCLSYLIGAGDSHQIAIVDPVLEHVKDYLELLDRNNYKLGYVIDTHTHADHISGASSLKDLTGCHYVMHEAAPAQCPDLRVSDRSNLELFRNLSVEVIHTPGHTTDSICLVMPDRILTGDTLFLDDGGAGRDDLPGGDPAAHYASLQRLSVLPEHLIVHPAHDYRKRVPSSLGQQKRTNPHLQKRSKEEFIQYLEDLRLGPADWMKDVLKANYACARDPNAVWIPIDAPACEVKGTLQPGVNEIRVSTVSSSMLRERLASQNPPLLLDVREPAELSEQLGHIGGALNVPIGSLIEKMSQLENSRDREIVTVCRSGARAMTAAQILTRVGFQRVSVLAGGMIAWNKTA